MSRKTMFVVLMSLIGLVIIATSVSSQLGDTEIKERGNTPAPIPTEIIKDLPKIQPTPMSEKIEDPETISQEGRTGRRSLEILNKVLGIPMEELEKMTAGEITELFTANADQLGVQVWGYIEDGTDRFDKVLIAGSEIFDPLAEEKELPSPTPEPTPDPGYPAPQSNTATEKSVAVVVPELSEALTQSLLLTTHKVFLPLVLREDSILVQISDAKAKSKSYIDKLYQDNAWNGYIKEYPAIPVWIYNTGDPTDYRSKRLLGHYYQTKSQPVGKVLDGQTIIGYDFEVENLTFEEYYSWSYGEPNLTVETIFAPGGEVHYYLIRGYWTGDTAGYEDLYFGNQLIWQDVYSIPYNTEYFINAGVNGSRPAHRFTIRHATKLGTYFYDYYTDPYKVQQLNYTANVYGFNVVPDIYAPLFGEGISASDSYLFSTDAYHDCSLVNNGMDSTISFGNFPHRYPYESKACISITSYIALSKLDYLVPALQAVHILNKYDDPDHVYLHPTGTGTTTPRQMARWLETKWNGYGIPAYLKDSQYASGIRTNAFIALETILGYRFNDTTSRSFADQGIEILLDTQVGNIPLYNSGEIPTSPTTTVYRPNQIGGQLLAWDQIPSGESYYYSLAPKTFLSDLVDMFSMPYETLGDIVSNAETTFSYWATLNLYEYYRYMW